LLKRGLSSLAGFFAVGVSCYPTVLFHRLGLGHERRTYRYAGRDFRLADVHGRVVREIMA